MTDKWRQLFGHEDEPDFTPEQFLAAMKAMPDTEPLVQFTIYRPEPERAYFAGEMPGVPFVATQPIPVERDYQPDEIERHNREPWSTRW